MHKAAPYRPDCRVSAEPFSQPGLGAAEFCDQHLDPRCAGFTRVCDAPRSAHPNVSIVKPVNSTLACSAGRPGRDRRRELLKRLALCSRAPAGGAEFYGATQYRDGAPFLGLGHRLAPPRDDGLRHQPFKTPLGRVAALQARRYGRGPVSMSLTCRSKRTDRWEKRARFGIAVPDIVHAQDTSGDGPVPPPPQRGPDRAPTWRRPSRRGVDERARVR